MTEQHECEWIVSRYEPLAYCEGCMVEEQVVMFLEMDEIQRRLNATERLKSMKARLYSEHIVEDPPFLVDECAADLAAYANIRDGK